MESFEFYSPTRIIFGKGAEEQAGQALKALGRKVLVHHYGDEFIRSSGLLERVTRSLKEAGLTVYELGGVKPNPRLGLVREGIKLCRQRSIDAILAIGGGSVIDSSKAIAAGTPYPGDVWDFFQGKATAEKALPLGVVLTIPAAGSEGSNGSVITNEDGSYKRSMNSELLRPRFAIMNPELTFSLPRWQTACGAADITAHVLERYFTRVKHVDLTDRLCEATLKTVIANAPRALEKPDDYDARAELMWASTIAHNDLLNTGRVGDWGSHMIEHELSATYDMTHGAGMAIVFPAWMTYVYEKDVELFAKFAVRVFGEEYGFGTPERTALLGISRLRGFYRQLGIPVTLKEASIPDDKLEEMAAKCTENGPVGNFVKLDRQDVLNVYRLARG